MKLMTITLSFSDGSVVLPMVVWTTQFPQIEGEGGSPPVQFHNTHAWMVGAGPLVSWSVAVVVRFSLPPPPAGVRCSFCFIGPWLHSQLFIWFSPRPVTELLFKMIVASIPGNVLLFTTKHFTTTTHRMIILITKPHRLVSLLCRCRAAYTVPSALLYSLA